jgi:DAK2 domain fusion protein YloV
MVKKTKGEKMKTMTMTQGNPRVSCSGGELRAMFSVATNCLARNATAIDALNVFPVPDGDTGTNMLLTMRSMVAEAERTSDANACDIAQAMARGALMGARGNSGVILSQIMKGFAMGFTGKESFGSCEMRHALRQASIAAYQSMSKPREGTMLTVIKDVASAVDNNLIQNDGDLVALMETVVEEANNSVKRTPQLLDVLREAGVVDAGGQGIYVILEGILRFLKDDETDIEPVIKETPAVKLPTFTAANPFPGDEKAYGYCTELIIKGDDLRQDQIRQCIERQGESVLVVGDREMIKVHVHTFHPGTIIEFAISLGSVHDLKIQNMDDQHEDFLQISGVPDPNDGIAIVAVVAGAGLEKAFRGLGATAIIPGGQTMNPSCSDILQAIDSTSADKVIILPNNKNIVPAARQAASASRKIVEVVPTRSIPQGLSALMGFNYETELEKNLTQMSRAQERVRSIEVTNAIRDAKIGTVQVQRGDYIGLIDGNIKFACKSLDQTIFNSLQAVDVENAGIASLFYGDQINDVEAKDLAESIKEKYPELEIELIQGCQPHYPYIISIE